jgi:hypothetical protein
MRINNYNRFQSRKSRIMGAKETKSDILFTMTYEYLKYPVNELRKKS